MRAKSDPSEVPRDDGPLFRLRDLSHTSDPATSVKAAASVIANGTASGDAAYLLHLVTSYPGLTMSAYGAIAADEYGGDPFVWRIKLGRRTGTLKDAGLIHPNGELAGLSKWWTGRAS